MNSNVSSNIFYLTYGLPMGAVWVQLTGGIRETNLCFPKKRFPRLVLFSRTSVIETSLDAPRRQVIFVLRPRKKIFSKVSENYKREI